MYVCIYIYFCISIYVLHCITTYEKPLGKKGVCQVLETIEGEYMTMRIVGFQTETIWMWLWLTMESPHPKIT